MRLALIFAMAFSIPPILAGFDRPWPGVTLMNPLDDSLAADLASLARFGMPQAARPVAAAAAVLTTPDSAVRKRGCLLLPAKPA
jgi:hypothetical protein